MVLQRAGLPRTGFGSVCTLATMYWTFFKGAAIMSIVYPLFILVACKSDPLRAYREGAHNQHRSPLPFKPC